MFRRTCKVESPTLRWHQIDFLNRTLTVGASKTEAGTGRVIPLNDQALMTLQTWATSFAGRQSEHCVFPREHYGFAGNAPSPTRRRWTGTRRQAT